MVAPRVNLLIDQGAKFDQTFLVKDKSSGDVRDLTGYTARLQARTSHDASTPLVSLTSGSGITLGGAAGTIRVTISATDTAQYTWEQGVYDLEIIPSSGEDDAERVLQGYVTVNKEVTR